MTWSRLCPINAVPDGEVLPVALDGEPFAVCSIDGKFHVIADRCTHADVPLSQGFFEGCEVECPLHGSRFDIRTGKCLSPPAKQDVAVFATEVRDGHLYIKLPDK